MQFDLTEARELFPITKRSIYFNHAAVGPMSVLAKRAVDECTAVYSRQAEFQLDEYVAKVKRGRELVAEFIGAEPEEITFTHNTSEGIYIALINLPLNEGDTVLIMDEVFPAVRYVADYNLPHLNIKYVPFAGRDAVEVVESRIDTKVRAVVVDFVQYLSGEMVDLKQLGSFLKSRGIYFVVDGIQAIGAVDFNVKETEVDFLACGAAKWLFGPSGTGFLYVNKRCFSSLKKFHTGWLGAEWLNFENCALQPPLYEDARMFEQGTRNIIGMSAFCENVKILLKYGLKNIEEHILDLQAALRRGFTQLNYEIITPQHGLQSGIITMRPRADAKALYSLLAEKNIVISLRSNCLRFSPHFYNTHEEVEQIFRVLKAKL